MGVLHVSLNEGSYQALIIPKKDTMNFLHIFEIV